MTRVFDIWKDGDANGQGVHAEDIINDADAVISVSEVSVKSEIKTSLFNNDGVTTLKVTR